MNLYSITKEYQQILDKIEIDEQINLDDIDRLGQLTDSIENKAINIAAYIKNLEAEKKAVEEARKNMTDREKRLDAKLEWLTDYLKHSLNACDIKEIKKSPYFAIKIKKCPPKVVIDNEEIIPNEYLSEKVIKSIDRTMLKEHLSNGVIIEGARLQQDTRLEIK